MRDKNRLFIKLRHPLSARRGLAQAEMAMSLPKTRLLLVEESPRHSALLRSAGQTPGHPELEITCCSQLQEALAKLRAEVFDVALLDLALPDSRGLATFLAVQNQAPSLPTIVLTDAPGERTGLEAVRRGAQHYVVKERLDASMLAPLIEFAIERKLADQQLKEREEFFRLILEHAHDLIAVLDRSGKRLYNSPSYKLLLGDPTAKAGTVSFKEIHPEDLAKIKGIFDETIATGVGQRTEYRFVLSDGSFRFVESLGSVIKDAAGQAAKVVVVSRDVTDRRNAEERLRESEALYHSLVESLPQNIFRKDLAGRFTFVNQRFCLHLKLPMSEVLGKTDFDFYAAEAAAKFQSDDRAILEKGDIFDTVEINQLADGRRMDVHVVKIPIYDQHGQVSGIQGIFWDITRQRQAEEQLLQTLADLKKSHADLKSAQTQLIHAAKLESVGTLAAGVAHEVKNPLQTILMGLHYLGKVLKTDNENVPVVLGEMKSAVTRADTIVKGLLHFSAANSAIVKEEDLNGVIGQAAHLVNYEFTKAKVTLSQDLTPGLPKVRLDKTKIEQVFINLMVNAIHAMPNGGHLQVRSRPLSADDPRHAATELPPGRYLMVELQDSGTGISEENLAKIWDPFFTTKPTGVGTGLGLPVTKKIIEMHGGHIAIGNAPTGGAQVTIILPAVAELETPNK